MYGKYIFQFSNWTLVCDLTLRHFWHGFSVEIVRGQNARELMFVKSSHWWNCKETIQKLIIVMMTSSNGNIFRVTGHLCGEFTGTGEFPAQRPLTRSFGAFFDLRLNKRLNQQPWGWWFETPAWSLWRHPNDFSARKCDCIAHYELSKHIVTLWRHMETQIWVDFGSCSGLLPDGINPLPEPMLANHQ